jgi:hypothetical protein
MSTNNANSDIHASYLLLCHWSTPHSTVHTSAVSQRIDADFSGYDRNATPPSEHYVHRSGTRVPSAFLRASVTFSTRTHKRQSQHNSSFHSTYCTLLVL